MFKTIVLGHLVYFQAVYKVVKNYHLVGGFNPSEKNIVKMGSSSPRTGVKRNNL